MHTNFAIPAPDHEAPSDRQSRILDAAERCFVRAGFHRTTMQDVAVEAGMSPGNLYRYFKSKDAMVAGLAERDRAELGRDFAALADADDFMAIFTRLGRKHFEEEPREKAILCLQIWAEATRDPTFAAIAGDFERDIVGHLTKLIGQAQARGGEVAAGVDPEAIAILICALGDGLFVRRAVVADFDSKHEVDIIMAVIEAALKGRLSLPRKEAVEEAAL